MNESSQTTNNEILVNTYTDCSCNGSIDTAFATLQETQIVLSHMADFKVNIMIPVSSTLLLSSKTKGTSYESLCPICPIPTTDPA